MNYEDIQKANETLKTTPLKTKNGTKEYVEVNQRIKAFRMLYPEGQILTQMLSNDNGVCVFRATISSGEGDVLATGHAYEKETSSFINKTSYIENCETSAVGRALGMLGIGIDASIASFEEVQNAIENQNKADDYKVKKVTAQEAGVIKGLLERTNSDVRGFLKHYKVATVEDMTNVQYVDAIGKLNSKLN